MEWKFPACKLEVANLNGHNKLLTKFCDEHELSAVDDEQNFDDSNLRIIESGQGLIVEWFSNNASFSQHNNKKGKRKPFRLSIDIQSFVDKQKTFPAPKQGAFNQALGKKTRHVVDATAGWAGDALLMCAQGYQVTLIERNPLMALLLKDAMQRLSETAWCNHNELVAPRVVNANTIDLMSSENLESDCVYLDPMFPKKKKKFAKTNKYMQFLQWLVGADADADSLLAAAINSGCPRIAVKRPDYAKPLMDDIIQPNECFSSKLVHYDVYLNPRHNILKPN